MIDFSESLSSAAQSRQRCD